MIFQKRKSFFDLFVQSRRQRFLKRSFRSSESQLSGFFSSSKTSAAASRFPSGKFARRGVFDEQQMSVESIIFRSIDESIGEGVTLRLSGDDVANETDLFGTRKENLQILFLTRGRKMSDEVFRRVRRRFVPTSVGTSNGSIVRNQIGPVDRRAHLWVVESPIHTSRRKFHLKRKKSTFIYFQIIGIGNLGDGIIR